MAKKRNMLIIVFSFFLAATVVLLIPGAGLATLPVPDNEPDAAVLALADYPHPSKRNIDDFLHSLLGFISSRLERVHVYAVSSDMPRQRVLQIPSVSLSALTIRAPPLPTSISFITSSFSKTYV